MTTKKPRKRKNETDEEFELRKVREFEDESNKEEIVPDEIPDEPVGCSEINCKDQSLPEEEVEPLKSPDELADKYIIEIAIKIIMLNKQKGKEAIKNRTIRLFGDTGAWNITGSNVKVGKEFRGMIEGKIRFYSYSDFCAYIDEITRQNDKSLVNDYRIDIIKGGKFDWFACLNKEKHSILVYSNVFDAKITLNTKLYISIIPNGQANLENLCIIKYPDIVEDYKALADLIQIKINHLTKYSDDNI